jgi:hypothetical protein
MDGSDQDRREFIRVPFRTQVTVRAPDRTLWANSTLDISLNGLRIATEERPLAEGTACEIEIVLSDADPPVIIEARGTVVRPEPGILAVHLTELDLDTYDHLRRLILNNAADPEKAEREFAAHWGIRKPVS